MTTEQARGSGRIADLPFTLDALAAAYAAGLRPAEVVAEAYRRAAASGDPGVFISMVDPARALAEAEALGPYDPARPLWGAPFAVKDNIDVAGCATTAGCPAFAYAPERDAFVVARLRAAGAIPIGKTNLDQFATGLVGVRSPYAPPLNALDPAIVPGGSSSGSGVAVARGIVAFSLGTDTAGSGRVPAALNNVVGLKPTLGALSATGVVPACRTLDTVSIFALCVADAYAAYAAAAGYDPEDAYARPVAVGPVGGLAPHPRIGVPNAASRRFFGDDAQAASFAAACDGLAGLGAAVVEIDFAPFNAVAEMLYAGAWVAERHSVVEALLATDPQAVHPTIRRIVEPAAAMTATETFRGFYRLEALRRAVEPALNAVDLLCVPSIPTFYSVADLAADPIGPNARLGTYTNFVNLLGLCALAVPTPARRDGRPGSVTLIARAGRDGALAALGARIEAWGDRRLGATDWPRPAPAPDGPLRAAPDELEVAVCGAHMSGLPLNGEIVGRGGRFLRATTTTADYRLYGLPGGPPRRPGLVRVPGGGAPIAVEVWALPLAAVGAFLAGVPAPLSIGTLALADGTRPKGFLCEAAAAEGATDLTAFGDWRRALAEAAA